MFSDFSDVQFNMTLHFTLHINYFLEKKTNKVTLHVYPLIKKSRRLE